MALTLLASVAGALLLVALVVRAVVGRRWDTSAIETQTAAMSDFLSQRAGVLVATDELDAFLERQQHPVAHYYSENAYKWAKRLLSARLPAAIVGYGRTCAERLHHHNLEEWERRATAALIDEVLHAAPETKYVSFSELAGAQEGTKGEAWRKLHIPESLHEYGLDVKEAQALGGQIAGCLEEERTVWNRKARQANLDAHENLFDNLETHPLTEAQRTAVVTDEDATLVLAGAGTGKTSVITAKVCYLLNSGLAAADEILVMAYNRKAAEELQERVGQAVSGNAPRISTFHAAGLSILKQSGLGDKKVAEWTNGAGLVSWIQRSLETMLRDEGFRQTAAAFVTMFGYKTYAGADKGGEFGTLQGWKVKSRQEQSISNWLYLNGYWADYERPYAEAAVSYEPDWSLGRRTYLEHFGVDRHGNTRPDIDARQYNEDMVWKRQLHAQQRTRLLETYSYQFTERTWQAALQSQMESVPRRKKPIDTERLLGALGRQVATSAGHCAAFLTLMKNSGMTLEQVASRLHADSLMAYRDECFLNVFQHLYEWYENELARTNSIDFADMCNMATDATRDGSFRSPFKYVLVDEFQDITRARADMVRSLLQSKRYSRLFAVGDDWQSIYRFSGAEIAVMASEFDDYFGRTEVCELDRSFRYTPSIGRVAEKFVMRNPVQLPKTVHAMRDDDQPGVVTQPYVFKLSDDRANVPQLTDALALVADEIDVDIRRRGENDATVLALGRQNFRADDAELLNPSMASVEFQTIHSSKGLEADYVVVLGLTSGFRSFPSDMVDDPILELTRTAKPEMQYGEERRLFYVALTRAKRRVWLMLDANEPSPFAHEIADIGVAQGDVRC